MSGGDYYQVNYLTKLAKRAILYMQVEEVLSSYIYVKKQKYMSCHLNFTNVLPTLPYYDIT